MSILPRLRFLFCRVTVIAPILVVLVAFTAVCGEEKKTDAYMTAAAAFEAYIESGNVLGGYEKQEVIEILPTPGFGGLYLLEMKTTVIPPPGMVFTAVVKDGLVLKGEAGFSTICKAAGFPKNKDALTTDLLILIDETLESTRLPITKDLKTSANPLGDVAPPTLAFGADGGATLVYFYEAPPLMTPLKRTVQIAADGTVTLTPKHR
jgi:hypothetical protein